MNRRAFEGAVWLFALRAIQLLCHALRLIVLARLLDPAQFGIFGIAVLCLTVVDVFSEPGFYAALIQRKGDLKPYLNTAWSAGLLRGGLLAALLIAAAPLLARLLHEPAAAPLIQAIAAVSVIRALTNISVIFYERELSFSRYFSYQFLGFLVEAAVAVAAALAWRSAWALAAGLLSGEAVRCIMSYVVDRSRPSFHLDRARLRELWIFGRWILGSNIILFLLTQGDNLVVGTALGAGALGLYQLAFRLAGMPQSEFSQLVSRVAYPLYAKLQDDREQLAFVYARVLQATFLVCIPAAALIHAYAEDFTLLMLGEKWLPMVPALRILTIYGALRAVDGTTAPIFVALGNPRLRAALQAAQLAVLALLIYPLSMRFGIIGAALAVTAYAALVNPVSVLLALKLIRAPLRPTGAVFVYSVVVACGIELIAALLRSVWGAPLSLAEFCVSAAASTLTAVVMLAAARRRLGYAWIFASGAYARRMLPERGVR